MKKNIDKITDLHNLVERVLKNAAHHAQDVQQVIPEITGCLIAYCKDIVTKYDKADDAYGNVVWFTSNGRQFCISYNHDTKNIEIKRNSQKGKVIGEINNSTNVGHLFTQLYIGARG